MSVSYDILPAPTELTYPVLNVDWLRLPICIASNDISTFSCWNRELVRIDAQGNITFADDLTVDELKFVVVEMAKLLAR